MPVVSASMVCESTAANVTAALRESLGSSGNGGCSSVTVPAATGSTADENGMASAAMLPNGIGGDPDDNDSLQSKLIGSARRVLFSKVDYEEVDNYRQAVLDTLKSKYVVIKPLANVANGSSTAPENGRVLTSLATCTSSGSNGNSNGSNNAPNGDGAPSQNLEPNGVSSGNAADCNGGGGDKSVAASSNSNCVSATTPTTPTTPNSAAVPTTGASSAAARRTGPEQPQPKRVLYPRENVRVGWKNGARKWQIGVGMLNIGNTCYLNSTLQALFHVPSLANWLVSEQPHVDRCDSGGSDAGCIICAMYKTLMMAQTHNSPFRPYHICSKLKAICRHLVLGRQEDAHEFLRYLVEAMEKSYLSRFRNHKELDQYSKETTPLNQILGGYLRSAVRCLSCSHVSVTFQHFQDLPLDIRKADTLEEALDGYFARERLEDMGYKCESCKKKVSATKQFYLERAPIVLCIQLKRFSVIGSKLNKQISIRLRLDLSKYQSPKSTHSACTYKLVSMITHLGASQHCGHYTAIGLTETGAYYTYDDSFVRPISTQGVCNTNSYIMFYEMEHAPSSPSPRTATVTSTQLNRAHLKESNANGYQPTKANGYSFSVKSNNNNNGMDNVVSNSNATTTTPPRMIGPQLPPGGLQSYSAGGSGSSSSSSGNGNPKIEIHFKNGTTSSAVCLNATSTTPTTSSSLNVVKSSSPVLLNGNVLPNERSGAGKLPESSHAKSALAADTSPKTGNGDASVAPRVLNMNESSCNSDPEEGVSSTTEGYADCSSTSSLPSMPDLLDDNGEDKSKLQLTLPTTTVRSMSTTSLVPYDLESDDDNTGNTVIRRQGSQSPASVKSERSDKPLPKSLKRSSSFSLFGSSDADVAKARKLANGTNSPNAFSQQSSKAKNKTDPNPIDAIFNAGPKLNANGLNGIKRKSQSPQLTLSIPETPTSPISDGHGSGNEESASPKNQDTFEPIQIQTKIGLWQVSDIKAESSEFESNEKKTAADSPSKNLATPPRTWTNPFSAKSAGSEKVCSPRQAERRAQFTGNGYKAGSKLELSTNRLNEEPGGSGASGTVSELLQQSHRGYGAPVLTWNGEQNDIEKELKNEAHDLRRQDLDDEDENEMDRGRQKKMKQQENHSTAYEQTPGYNPFQEHDNQRRWKANNSANSSNGNGNANSSNSNANSYRNFSSNYRQQTNQRNKPPPHKRYNHPYNKCRRIHQQQQASSNSNGNHNSNGSNNISNTNNNSYATRRES